DGVRVKVEFDLIFFFFQAEDGIRDYKVTGVQTCALPILLVEQDNYQGALTRLARLGVKPIAIPLDRDGMRTDVLATVLADLKDRSEERRVGKECRAQGWAVL